MKDIKLIDGNECFVRKDSLLELEELFEEFKKEIAIRRGGITRLKSVWLPHSLGNHNVTYKIGKDDRGVVCLMIIDEGEKI